MRIRFTALIAALTLAAAPLRAQTVQFQFTDAGAGYNANGIYVGTYGGTWDYLGSTAHHVGLNCVDFFHEVITGEIWTAHVSSIGTGNLTFARNPTALDKYQQAAWLISNYSPSNVLATQSTLWNLFANPGALWPSDPTLLAAAQAPHPGFDYSHWFVVTDVRSGGPNDDKSAQEFVVYDASIDVTATPEPATLTLLGTGLVGIAGAGMRRRKRNG